jgi:PAS domain S-box-containing protein
MNSAAVDLSMFDEAPVGLALCDEDGRFVDVSNGLAAILGRRAADVIGMHYADVVHPDDRPAAQARMAEFVSGPAGRHRHEERYLRPDGEVRWVAVVTTRTTNGRPTAASAVIRVVDITARRRAETERDRFLERLKRREAQLAEAQAIAHVGSWEYDFATQRTACSEELFRIFGLDPATSPRDVTPLFDWVHLDDREAVRAAAWASFESATPFSVECRIIRADGAERIVHVQGRFSTDATGHDRLVGTLRDVTAQRHAGSKHRDSEERFRAIFENGPMGIATVDASLRLLHLNAALADLLGQSPEHFVGRTLVDITHPEDIDFTRELARKAMAGEVPGYDVENRFVHRDGDVVWARVRVTLLRTDAGETRYGFVFVEDITEAREAERARLELDSLKDGFVRVVAHDLQGPLSVIAGLAELLARPSDQPRADQTAILERISRQSERLRRTVARLLDVDRLYRGGLRALREPTDLGGLVEGVVQTVDALGHPLSVDFDRAVVDVDATQLEHILDNLLDNAFTHTKPGTPVYVRVKEGPEAVTIAVDDEGAGVPDAVKEGIFELFRTGEAITGRTGIGLWAVARFAELHGGRAWVEDRPGGGAAFRVFLPTAP